jgi:hypothetical protein
MQKKKRNDWRTHKKRIIMKFIIEICFFKRKRGEIFDLLQEDYKADITYRQFHEYLLELQRRGLLLREKALADTRTYYYFVNDEKVGKQGIQYLRG